MYAEVRRPNKGWPPDAVDLSTEAPSSGSGSYPEWLPREAMPPLGSPSSAPICQNLSNFSVPMGCFLIPIDAHRSPISLGERNFSSDTLANLRAGWFPPNHPRTRTRSAPPKQKLEKQKTEFRIQNSEELANNLARSAPLERESQEYLEK